MKLLIWYSGSNEKISKVELGKEDNNWIIGDVGIGVGGALASKSRGAVSS